MSFATVRSCLLTVTETGNPIAKQCIHNVGHNRTAPIHDDSSSSRSNSCESLSESYDVAALHSHIINCHLQSPARFSTDFACWKVAQIVITWPQEILHFVIVCRLLNTQIVNTWLSDAAMNTSIRTLPKYPLFSIIVNFEQAPNEWTAAFSFSYV